MSEDNQVKDETYRGGSSTARSEAGEVSEYLLLISLHVLVAVVDASQESGVGQVPSTAKLGSCRRIEST